MILFLSCRGEILKLPNHPCNITTHHLPHYEFGMATNLALRLWQHNIGLCVYPLFGKQRIPQNPTVTSNHIHISSNHISLCKYLFFFHNISIALVVYGTVDWARIIVFPFIWMFTECIKFKKRTPDAFSLAPFAILLICT